MLNLLVVETVVKAALAEDLGNGDLTSNVLFTPSDEGHGEIIAMDEGIVAGLPVAALAFKCVFPGCNFTPLVSEGTKVTRGLVVAAVKGPLLAILGAERVALNFLQRMSGIATYTASYVDRIRGYKARICDTRKTAPGLRLIDKYAVRVGGGINHRFSLGDAVLLKDNHLKAAGGILPAVKKLRQSIPLTAKIEVEVENLDQVEEALAADVDIIMLDNMKPQAMYQAVQRIAGRALVEASGGITLDQVEEVAATGVDFISVGALTHSAPTLNFSLELANNPAGGKITDPF